MGENICHKGQKVLLVTMITVFCLMFFSSTAFAAYAYNYGRTNGFVYASDCVGYAHAAWTKLGFTSSRYLGSSFTAGTFLANCPYGNGVYAYTHGSPDSLLDNASGIIYRWDVNYRRNSDWKRLVFLDACKTADNSNWAAAWGIRTGDGDKHAFIGWVGYAYDSWRYANFRRAFWDKVGARRPIKEALVYAWIVTDITNCKWYGNVDWSY